jgi:hypothetical protein
MTNEHIEQIATEVATKATYGGAATGFFGWLMSSSFIGLIGAIAAVLGVLVNWYYKHKHYKLAEREVNERIKAKS